MAVIQVGDPAVLHVPVPAFGGRIELAFRGPDGTKFYDLTVGKRGLAVVKSATREDKKR